MQSSQRAAGSAKDEIAALQKKYEEEKAMRLSAEQKIMSKEKELGDRVTTTAALSAKEE